MSSTARNLIDAALAADLTQNELKVFLALFRQTLCYGKRTDPLTIKRLVALTKIRKDRITKAIEGIIHKGLFERTDHPIFEVAYSIPVAFMGEQDSAFFAPHLLKVGNYFCAEEDPPEKQKDTYIHLTPSTTTTSPPPSSSRARELDEQYLPYPSQLHANERQQAAKILDSLSPQQAHDCLSLLKIACDAGRVKSPLGYLYQLSQATRAGRLDCSPLFAAQIANDTPFKSQPLSTQNTHYRLKTLACDIEALDRLYQLSGLEMDATTTKHKQALVSEFKSLQAQLQEGLA